MGQSRKGLWQIQGGDLCMALPKNSTYDCLKVFRTKDGFAINRFDQDELDVKAELLTKNYQFD